MSIDVWISLVAIVLSLVAIGKCVYDIVKE